MYVYNEMKTTQHFYGLYDSKIIIKIRFGLEGIHDRVTAKGTSDAQLELR